MYRVILLEPAKNFIDTVNPKMQVKILRTIDLLTKFGPFLKEPHSKKLTGYNIHALRENWLQILSDYSIFMIKAYYMLLPQGL